MVPDVIRRLWSRQREPLGDHYDIYEIEGIGPSIVLHNFGHLMRGMLWIQFIDNANALAALVRGSSRVVSADVIVGHTSRAAAELGLWSWFDRVDTKSNPVDGLSRGRLHGPWHLVEVRIPEDMLKDLEEEMDRQLDRERAIARKKPKVMQ